MPSSFLGRVRRAVLARDGGGLTDAQLLGCFLERRDSAAFEALVRRHGPMVLGACRRILGDTHDAEDAFQAAFLVFVRKAGSIRARETVGGWLYGVACRTALEARSRRARRRARERQVEDMPHPAVEPEDTWRELKPLLDRELGRLPEKYRVPVVLCDLEGLPRKQAARQLGVPEGTLSSRLATARRTLAKRLARYGLSVSGGALAAALTNGARAAVPPPLLISTVKAAVGPAVTASAAAALSKEVLKSMFLAKLKLAVGAVMVAAALGAGGVAYHTGGAHGAAQEGKPAPDLEALRKENELLKLNLQVVLEKVRAQEAELRTLKEQAKAGKALNATYFAPVAVPADANTTSIFVGSYLNLSNAVVVPDPVREAEAALKALREARDPEAKRRAAEALEQAAKKLRGQPPKPANPAKKRGK